MLELYRGEDRRLWQSLKQSNRLVANVPVRSRLVSRQHDKQMTVLINHTR